MSGEEGEEALERALAHKWWDAIDSTATERRAASMKTTLAVPLNLLMQAIQEGSTENPPFTELPSHSVT